MLSDYSVGVPIIATAREAPTDYLCKSRGLTLVRARSVGSLGHVLHLGRFSVTAAACEDQPADFCATAMKSS